MPEERLEASINQHGELSSTRDFDRFLTIAAIAVENWPDWQLIGAENAFVFETCLEHERGPVDGIQSEAKNRHSADAVVHGT